MTKLPASDEKQLYDRSIATILDSIDALVYVADMDTYELIFINKYGRDIWGDIQGQICWQTLQEGQDGPCEFCTNDRLIDKDGKPTGVYVWEFQNTVNKRWYQCRDEAVLWVDGRLVRMETAADITERKLMEKQLETAKLRAEELARRDELTGLCNRREFFIQGGLAFKRASRSGGCISVVMMDIDYFKEVNDKYGHFVGDKVLKHIADSIKTIIREIDIVARVGGEEFAFVLPETGVDEAVNLVERLRKGIANTAVEFEDVSVKVTVSFGVCSCVIENETLETILTKADDSLYIAKRKGRNQVKTC
jgi:diguanylate cyclase (GGDEF)-like protein